MLSLVVGGSAHTILHGTWGFEDNDVTVKNVHQMNMMNAISKSFAHLKDVMLFDSEMTTSLRG